MFLESELSILSNLHKQIFLWLLEDNENKNKSKHNIFSLHGEFDGKQLLIYTSSKDRGAL